MITISNPALCKNGKNVRFQSRIIDEVQNINEVIWFETDSANSLFFDEGNSDAFLVLVLILSVFYNEDIKVEGKVSDILLYNIRNYILPLLQIAYGGDNLHHVQITSEVSNFDYQPTAVATGCSLGIDSFSSILHHTSDNLCPPSFRLTHLTYFNVGAMGSFSSPETEGSFFKDLKMVQDFANKLELPVIWVNSNVHILYQGFSFNATHTFRNMSVVLSMPNLFHSYFYASGYSYIDYSIDKEDFAKFEDVVLSHLSNGTTFLYSDDASLSRFDKTEYVAKTDLAKSRLYVCLKEQIKNDHSDDNIVGSSKLNCSRCEKCLRTLVTLDVLGCLNEFDSIFDLAYYQKIRYLFIAKLLSQKRKNLFYKEIFKKMRERHYHIPIISQLISPLYDVYSWMSGTKIQKSILKIIRKSLVSTKSS